MLRRDRSLADMLIMMCLKYKGIIAPEPPHRVYGKINRLAIIYSYDINYLNSIRCVFIFLQSLNWFFTIPRAAPLGSR